MRRCLGISLAGNRPYLLDGYTETLLAGADYYFRLKNGKAFKAGLSNAWIRDNALGLSFAPDKVDFYPEKGIAVTFGYPVGPLDLELRGIYAYHINSQIHSEVITPFDEFRISAGLTYKINPLKSKKKIEENYRSTF